MTRQLFERMIGLVLILFLMIYMGFQAYRYFKNPVETDTVFEYTVTRSLSVEGVAVRRETPLEQTARGSEYYLAADAQRVATGETVAESSRGGISSGRAAQLETEIARLREAQSVPIDYANTDTFNREIKSLSANLSAMAREGHYEQLDEVRGSLTMDFNKKQISAGKASDFERRITQLEKQLQTLERTVSASAGTAVAAPAPGYFSKVVDGYETSLSPDDLEDLSVDECLALIEPTGKSSGKAPVGKLVTSQNWIYMAAVPRHNLEWIKAGQPVQIQFDQISRSVPATISKVVDDRKGDTAILLLSCNYMSEDLINLRHTGAIIEFQSFTGILIDSANLRFRKNPVTGESERGVYILRGGSVYFRLVDPVYEESGFVLTKTYYTVEEYLEPQRQARSAQNADGDPGPDPPDLSLEEEEGADAEVVQEDYKRYVLLFDQVITKGMDMYDGKAILEY